MHITRGYRTELDLNNKQMTACKKHAGCARFAWNWGLKRKQEIYQESKQWISAMELHKELNALNSLTRLALTQKRDPSGGFGKGGQG